MTPLVSHRPELTEPFPDTGTPAEKLTFLLRYAVLSPSGHNTQPWRFRVVGDRLELHADRTRSLPVVDPDDRALVISCGSALGFLTTALRRFGHSGEVRLLPDPGDPDLLASVGVGSPYRTMRADRELFEAMGTRHTHRGPFRPLDLPAPVAAAMTRDAERAGVALHWLKAPGARQQLASLIGEGDRRQMADQPFRAELASWVRPNRTRRRDGVPGFAFGVADLPSILGPTVMRTFDLGGRQAAKDEVLATTAPELVVVATGGDDPVHSLATGRALAAVLLRAAAGGIAASFLNQPIEVPELRGHVSGLLGGGDHPQLILRLGYPVGVDRATPRRPASDVLVAASSG